MHGVLLRSGRGSTKDPGRFRRSQNWLGGTRPGNAAFVPPPHLLVPDLREPILYLSLFFKQHRSLYYDRLDGVRRTGDWEAWLGFFLQGVRETAEGAIATERHLTRLFARHREDLERQGRRAGSALRVHEVLKARPLLTIGKASDLTGLSFPAASSAIDLLEELDIVREVTGRQRGRVYAYGDYIEVLNEGTEPL